MLKKLKTGVIIILCLLIFTTLLGNYLRQRQQGKKKVEAFISIKAQQVISFRIYARVDIPMGVPIKFKGDEQIVQEFFHSISDVHPYWRTHDEAQKEHRWFMEIMTRKEITQIHCYIPYKKGEVVVCTLGLYGDFQSKQLFDWYQKYSHRWLKPEASQPTSTPQPDPPGSE